MMIISQEQYRQSFGIWLRTGRWPVAVAADGREFKFNPYHDPRDGRFTFAPGEGGTGGGISRTAKRGRSQASLTAARPEPPMGRGNNARAFNDPMTLEQVFPGLNNAQGGAIIAVADDMIGLTGPATAMTAGLLQDQAKGLEAQIKAIDPKWHYDEIGPTDALGNRIVSVTGLTAKVNDLRFQRAVLIARTKGDYRPLQVETARFIQQSADSAYSQGLEMLKAGNLRPLLSDQEALGNFVDARVRADLRQRYNRLGMDSAGPGPVRVNRRENDSSGSELTYRRPDARVNNVAYDVTLTRKTMATAQIRGFFNADFRPSRVIIIRPSQLGADHFYAITRPEVK